jgi:serine/threonine-protein kinase
VSESDPATDFPPGTILLDRYRVIRELGVGGMSRVVAAEHVALGTKVAIKVLLPQLAKLHDAAQRFEREALAATRFESEHVARVLDVGVLPSPGPGAGTPYMVIEYLEGQDLGRLVRAGRLFSAQDAIALIVQAADALSRAHAAGVVHRDVKPSNLFLTRRPDGSPLVKVLDFGISKLVQDAAQEDLALTKTTAVMGSALYMSLEQMRSTKTVDRRTDVWALGVSLYELLTGTHPWTAEVFSELCVKVSLDPPDPLRRHRPDLPEALAQAIAVAYERKPEERYQSVGQLVEALAPFADAATKRQIKAIVEFEQRSFRGLTSPVRPIAPPRLHWAVWAVLGGAVIAGAAAVGLSGTTGPHGETTSGVADAAASVDAAASDAAVEDAGIADAASDAAAMDDGGVIAVSADAGVTRVDGGAIKPPSDPCAGKPPTAMVRRPDGLMVPCSVYRRGK